MHFLQCVNLRPQQQTHPKLRSAENYMTAQEDHTSSFFAFTSYFPASGNLLRASLCLAQVQLNWTDLVTRTWNCLLSYCLETLQCHELSVFPAWACTQQLPLLPPIFSYHTFKAVAPIYYFLINCLGWLLIADQCKALPSPPGLSTFPSQSCTPSPRNKRQGWERNPTLLHDNAKY